MPTYLQDEVILSLTRNLELTGHYSMQFRHNDPKREGGGEGAGKKRGGS